MEVEEGVGLLDEQLTTPTPEEGDSLPNTDGDFTSPEVAEGEGDDAEDTAQSTNVPAKFVGKSQDEIISAYVHLEKEMGRLRNELGQAKRQQPQEQAQPQPAQPAQTVDQAQQEQDEIRALAMEEYTDLLALGMPEYSQDDPSTWNMAVKRATRNYQREKPMREMLAQTQQILNETVANTVIEREAAKVLGDAESAKDALATLNDYIPVSFNEWQALPAELKGSLLRMAQDASKGRKAANPQATVPVKRVTQQKDVVPVLTGDTTSEIANNDPRLNQERAKVKQLFAGTVGSEYLTDDDITELALQRLKKGGG